MIPVRGRKPIGAQVTLLTLHVIPVRGREHMLRDLDHDVGDMIPVRGRKLAAVICYRSSPWYHPRKGAKKLRIKKDAEFFFYKT